MASELRLKEAVAYWEIMGVLPKDFEDFGDWVMQKVFHQPDIKTGPVYHKHISDNKITLFVTGNDKRCRQCGILAPSGVLFRARTAPLDATGDTQ